MAKNRPYTFYDTTSSVCTTCLRQVEAKILFKNNHVYMDKWCPAHGTERVLMADDVAWYRACREVYVKQPEMPQQFNTSMQYGCPYDCGLCPDHMQHSCLSIIELTDQCNLQCPTCYAGSGPHVEKHHSFEDIVRMLDAVVANEGEPDVVQLSGGEPTLHPRFFDILDEARKRPIRHLMINTNGIKLAREPEFCERLAGYGKGLEIYLQFDSFKPEALHALRGADLRGIRQQALDNLNRFNISTTLVVTLKKGLNDDEIGDIIQFGLKQPCVRGVTLQPIQNAGRVLDYDAAQHRLTVSEIRRRIAEQSGLFTLDDVIPVPCNPDTLAMAYALKLEGDVVPLTRFVDPATLVEGARNTIVFEHDPMLKEQVFKLFSTNHSPESQANCLADLMCCLPKVQAPVELGYQNVFRVLIVQFMDAQSLDIRALKKSCIHIAQADGKLIPFESFNLFYRGGRKQLLEQIRGEISQQTRYRQLALVQHD
ncbi:radical SAM protein [Amantichitinum ursilacus]|uniref:Cyclic pyranopterin monophosphate synthase 1 n=1 Tax=Amantichitinum ursilacus TaxID=857265 RepID=A0A0N0GPJ1_9NEIS|nr:radical SAM protein [Amantichitinum ursilacus]KPC53753.1 Cyclic pyranopterin monophosphate synthase 1 [Amantichitinum ursilacus]